MERRLAAILAADVVGYSRLMGEDETGTLERLKSCRSQVIDPKIAEHRGRLIKLMGDGALVEFGSVVNAVTCAVDIQRAMAVRNAAETESTRIEFRIGINLGDVIVEGDDLYGDGVNIAARLEACADAGGICLSDTVYQQVKAKFDLGFEDLGEQRLKNMTAPVRAFRVRLEAGATASTPPAALPAATDKPSIAVLPFANMSGDPDQEYFSDGITEDIITDLSRFHEFAVIARNSTFHYKGQSRKIADVCRELGARYVVEGSVRRSGDRIRVTAQLIDGTSGAHLWADRYDRQLADIFQIQDEVTQAVVVRVAEGIKGAGAVHVPSHPSHSATAYDLVLQARPYRTDNTRRGSEKAIQLLRQAIALDPRYALAHASLAFALCGQSESGWADDPDAVNAAAVAAAQNAVAFDASDGYAHASLAYALYRVRDFDRADHEAGVALSLNPNHANIIMTRAWISLVCGNAEEAIKLIQRARRLNPYMGGWELTTLGEAYLDARQYTEALDCFAKAIPPPTILHLEMAICHAYLGQVEEARSSLLRFLGNAQREISPYPGDDGRAWRAYLELVAVRRRREDTEHLIEGARLAGLPVDGGAVR